MSRFAYWLLGSLAIALASASTVQAATCDLWYIGGELSLRPIYSHDRWIGISLRQSETTLAGNASLMDFVTKHNDERTDSGYVSGNIDGTRFRLQIKWKKREVPVVYDGELRYDGPPPEGGPQWRAVGTSKDALMSPQWVADKIQVRCARAVVEPGMENETDRPGSDIDVFDLSSTPTGDVRYPFRDRPNGEWGPQVCQRACIANVDCKAWSLEWGGRAPLNLNNVVHQNSICRLKKWSPPKRGSLRHVSGIKPQRSFDQPGNIASRPAGPSFEQPPPIAEAGPKGAAPYGSIGDKYAKLGGFRSGIGSTLGSETDAPHGGRCQRFEHGSICWHPQIGEAFTVWGDIHKKWLQHRGVEYGYPITDELTTPDGRGRFNHFRAMQLPGRPEASIYWTPQTGAAAVWGAIRDAWAKQGWERGPLGYPTSDEHQDGKYRRVNFERGAIRWAPDTGIEVVK